MAIWHIRDFVPSKPITGLPPQGRRLYIQRKYNGLRHYLLGGTVGHGVYSSAGRNVSETFPLADAYLEDYVGEQTIYDAEFVVLKNDKDDFDLASSICHSKPAIGLELNKTHRGVFIVFDVLYMCGEPVYKLPYEFRYELLSRTIGSNQDVLVDTLAFGVKCVTNLKLELTDAVDFARKNHWEGLIAWLADESTVVNWNNGQAKRCNCYKIKDVSEDDFIAMAYELGEGENKSKVGALHLAQLDTHGNPIYCGKVGSGLSALERSDALKWTYPCVVQVKYVSRLESGKLCQPVFMRKREDKTISQCFMV